jgi:hypothetical protein
MKSDEHESHDYPVVTGAATSSPSARVGCDGDRWEADQVRPGYTLGRVGRSHKEQAQTEDTIRTSPHETPAPTSPLPEASPQVRAREAQEPTQARWPSAWARWRSLLCGLDTHDADGKRF